ncbi:(Fe-S)-binding protein [Oceanibacterium hippocampi]|uniref:Lactate utilization protein A n=1 Tax=Oceanibacterium hippocampi TaxID=745714 RepID=A0A1Y5RRS8_9PROT|nr:(Fe-S)-binding protein [Oceanibacterium hippocampi]SLN21027.1 Lactate utilization protein A [Oceanibacterium hippocampi]
MTKQSVRVGLFVTCLVDLFRPSVGFAAVKLLEAAGCVVEVPAAQTCCGQPAYNSGDRADTAALARNVIAAFEGFDHVVAPSGSCAGMLKHHYPRLFDDDPAMKARAERFADKVHELVSFLVDVMEMPDQGVRWEATATYHDSCSGLRELKVREQPRALLGKVEGLTLTPLPGAETCCGFGGTFAVKYGEVSTDMVSRKCDDVAATGADLLLAGDLGCLMNIAGRFRREGKRVECRHVAEVLAGLRDVPAIGEGG